MRNKNVLLLKKKHNFILYEGNTAILKFQGVTLLLDKSVHQRVNSNSALILIAYGNDGRIYECRTGRYAKMCMVKFTLVEGFLRDCMLSGIQTDVYRIIDCLQSCITISANMGHSEEAGKINRVHELLIHQPLKRSTALR